MLLFNILMHLIVSNYISIGDFGCSEEALIVCAMTQIQNVFITPSDKKVASVSGFGMLITFSEI